VLESVVDRLKTAKTRCVASRKRSSKRGGTAAAQRRSHDTARVPFARPRVPCARRASTAARGALLVPSLRRRVRNLPRLRQDIGIDWGKVIPDERLRSRGRDPARDGKSSAWSARCSRNSRSARRSRPASHGPLSENHRKMVVDGEDRGGEGSTRASRLFEWLETRTYKIARSRFLARLSLVRFVRGVRRQPLNDAAARLPRRRSRPRRRGRAWSSATPIGARGARSENGPGRSRAPRSSGRVFATSEPVGLGYLTLDRPARTLSAAKRSAFRSPRPWQARSPARSSSSTSPP